MSSDALITPPGEPESMADMGSLASPPTKRMKQGRLPFKPLGQKILPSVQTVTKECKKRKLSDPESPVAKQPKSTKSPLVDRPSPKITCPENDNEVSSSSEADVHYGAGISKPTGRKINTLERFVCPVRKEDDITSTNDVVDLTGENSRDCFPAVENGSNQISSVKENVNDQVNQPMVVDEPMEVETENDKENQPTRICSSSKSCEQLEDDDNNSTDNVTKIIEQVASGDHLVCDKKDPQDSVSKQGKSVILQLLKSSPVVHLHVSSEVAPAAIVNTAVTSDMSESAPTQSASNTTSSSTSTSANMQVPLLLNGLKAYMANSTEKVNTNTQTGLKAVPEIPTVDLCTSTSEQSDHDEISHTGDSAQVASEPQSPPRTTDQSECSSKENSPAGDSPLESSFMSPQTADERKATSAGSTPRTSKPRSKLSSEKKAERDAHRQKRKAEKEKELMEKKRLKEEARDEKERLRKDEKEKKEKERLQKDQEKQEKKQQLEQEKQERQNQKDEERKKKQEVIDAKLEEKKKKDEEKRQIEEEKRLKDEEKHKEEEERISKKKKMQEKFQSFFTKSKMGDPQLKVNQTSGPFMPFELKKDMKLAPKNMFEISDDMKDSLGTLLHSQDTSQLYLKDLKSGKRKPRKFEKSGTEAGDEDIFVLGHDSEVVKKVTYRVKLIQFHTNYRPPYYGTWRKKSKTLSARNPWKMDSSLLDYEVDSDDEWEEEEPGESLSASEGEEEKDDKEDGEEEDEEGWMVPHGYLSEDEGCEEDEEVTAEVLKARRAAKQEVWESELKRQCQPQMAMVLGCYWVSDVNPNPGTAFEKLIQYKITVCCEPDTTIGTSFTRVDNTKQENSAHVDNGVDKSSLSASGKGAQKKPVPEEAMPDLLRMVHGNSSGIKRLVDEFRLYWKKKGQQGTAADDGQESQQTKEEAMEVEEETPTSSDAPPSSAPPAQALPTLNPPTQVPPTIASSAQVPSTSTVSASAPHSQVLSTSAPPKGQEDNDSSDKVTEDEFTISKRQMEMRIAAVAIREKRSTYKKVCWYVHDSILKQYGLEDLPVPTTWQYVSIPNKRESLNPDGINTSGRKTPNSKMFASMLASPQQSSPGEYRPDKLDNMTSKRNSDQWSIKFFTKAKDAIAKEGSKPEISARTDSSLKVNPALIVEDDCQIVALKLSPTSKMNDQQSMTFVSQLKKAAIDENKAIVIGTMNGLPQNVLDTCGKPVPIAQNLSLTIPSPSQTSGCDLTQNNASSDKKTTEVNGKAAEGCSVPDVILLD